MILDRISGSIDMVFVGALVAAVGYLLDSRIVGLLAVGIVVLGTVKVTYDHLTGFEDPLGIEWRENEGDTDR